jgi:hypothetical protein
LSGSPYPDRIVNEIYGSFIHEATYYSSTKPRLGTGDNLFQGSQIDATLLQKEKKKKKRRNTSMMVGDFLT